MKAMRDAFLDEVYNIAKEDSRVVLMSADFGAPSLDKFRRDLSGQFINVGIAEQNMVSVAAGLALAGKIVFCYAVIPFVTLRCFEQIKVDLCCMNLPVTLIGVGAGYAYDDSGPTHHGLEDLAAMRTLPNMTILNASDSVMAAAFAKIAYESPGPKYIRLDREKWSEYYPDCYDFSNGFLYSVLDPNKKADMIIIATGFMVHQATKVGKELVKQGVTPSFGNLYKIKPIEQNLISNLTIHMAERVVTLEEHFLNGGIGSIVAEIIADSGLRVPLKRFGIPNQYCFKYGGRDLLHKDCGLDVETIVKGILQWIK